MPDGRPPDRDGFDDLGEGWEVMRPAGRERRGLGHMPGTEARRRYGLEHVPDGGVAFGVVEQGTWRQPKWSLWARRQRPRSVVYERAGDGRVNTVAEAVAAIEARYAEVERRWLARAAPAPVRPNTSGGDPRPLALRNTSGNVPDHFADPLASPRNTSGGVPDGFDDALTLRGARRRIAELEAEVAALRTALRKAAAPGWGRANRGRAARADRHALAAAEEIARVREERRGDQLSNEDIARALDGRVPTAAGRGGWTRMQVGRVLRRLERIRGW